MTSSTMIDDATPYSPMAIVIRMLPGACHRAASRRPGRLPRHADTMQSPVQSAGTAQEGSNWIGSYSGVRTSACMRSLSRAHDGGSLHLDRRVDGAHEEETAGEADGAGEHKEGEGRDEHVAAHTKRVKQLKRAFY